VISFGRLLSFPLQFRNLGNKIKQIEMNEIGAILKDNKITINSTANGHHVEILAHGSSLTANTPVEIFCDCEFFKYNLAFGLSKVGSLLHPESFVLVPPKSKNMHLTLSGCKHIILMAQTVFQNRQFIRRS